MKLELENGTTFESPSEQDIEHALDALGRPGIGFAILSRDAMTYVQTAGSRDEGYQLEYQDGDTDRHYRLADLVPRKVAVSIFLRYAKNELSWRNEYPWIRENIGAQRAAGCLGVILTVMVSVLVVTDG